MLHHIFCKLVHVVSHVVQVYVGVYAISHQSRKNCCSRPGQFGMQLSDGIEKQLAIDDLLRVACGGTEMSAPDGAHLDDHKVLNCKLLLPWKDSTL